MCLESLSCWNIYDGIPLWNNETWPFHVFVFILHHDPCYVQKQAQHNSMSKSPSSQCIQQCALCLHSGWWFDLCCLKLSIYVPFIRLIIWICVTIHLNKIDCYCCVISLKQIPDPIQVILIDFITETHTREFWFQVSPLTAGHPYIRLQLSKHSTGQHIGHCWFV